ncbi:Nramp family divalent metal transporter [Swingsia samuiensis]|uniref:Divalent metal cation transporter MntH n=1 Tax=Swingsia samuiensis TaxID=1293412 RepID=A0A4Y6UJE5_9PROT|nr:Nramp family divalent metal transporter [Swingsia samuiensis]QDH17723.1 divalent metal cation transporter [Swingsia samuiensis]
MSQNKSLSEVFSSIRLPEKNTVWFKRFLAFVGPGYMISVGYMDPGNWETDIQGGAQYGYTLLCSIILSNLIAILLQALAARLGIATGKDLAQACKAYFPPFINIPLWFACEIAIIACDLAEVIGTAVALQLLFGFPLIMGALISAFDAILVLLLMGKGFRYLESFVISLISIIAVCFFIQLIAASPPLPSIFQNILPSAQVIKNPGMLYIAIGIIGATVMPHNLYLHSSIVQTRAYERSVEGKTEAIKWATLDSSIALMFALFINAAILIVSAAAFHTTGHKDVSEISEAYRLLSPALGISAASTLFAVALLAAGTNSTVTGTLAGQIIMEGFLNLKIPSWARRLITRSLAIIPVIFVILLYGEQKIDSLLMLSQIILSFQLPFAIIPLVLFSSKTNIMKEFVIPKPIAFLSWAVSIFIIILNIKLIIDSFT